MNCVALIAKHAKSNQTTNNIRRTACFHNGGDLRGGALVMLTGISVEVRSIFDAMTSPFARSVEDTRTLV